MYLNREMIIQNFTIKIYFFLSPTPACRSELTGLIRQLEDLQDLQNKYTRKKGDLVNNQNTLGKQSGEINSPYSRYMKDNNSSINKVTTGFAMS